MKSFQCQNCGQLLFFENTRCLQCDYPLGYLPDQALLSAIDCLTGDIWQPLEPSVSRGQFRLCLNYRRENVCNWLVPAGEGESFCLACRLNQTIPNLDEAGHRELWYRLETAKRRLVYSLLKLGLPVVSKKEEPARGLAFAFLAAPDSAEAEPVTTGHAGGLITINIAEADSVVREKTRLEMKEPYRTLLGHMRHESGHYYWMRLIEPTAWLEQFRRLFGDERADYRQALARHYAQGAPEDWQQHFVSAYATGHPWEDWAETWAHYLHITDTIETAQEFAIKVKWSPAEGDSALTAPFLPLLAQSFPDIFERWLPLTYAINSINRSMGQPDMYPFVLSPAVVEKLSFVHDVVRQSTGGGP